MLLEENGFQVTNLGSCVPEQLLAEECLRQRPDLLVISSVNGHGFQDGLRVINYLRSTPELAETPTVIGGKLGIDGADGTAVRRLLEAGFNAVYQDTSEDLRAMRSFARALVESAEA